MAEISREPIIKLQPYLDQAIMVNFVGGRVIEGTLKGFDHLNNLVINDAIEHIRGKNLQLIEKIDPKDSYGTTGKKRDLGLLMVKGTSVSDLANLGANYMPDERI